MTEPGAPRRIEIVVHGASGRMGRAVARLAGGQGFLLGAQLAREARPARGILATRDWDGRGDVVVDFSLPPAIPGLCERCAEHGVALVSGTTGLDAAAEEALDDLAQVVPVLHARNFSPGLALLEEALRQLAGALPADVDCEIVEEHHRGKVDAPSGTALQLAEVVRDARGGGTFELGRAGRQERAEGAIGLHALRLGGTIGRHTVHLASPTETLRLEHEVHDRDVFALGALRAAGWLTGAGAGRYRLVDALQGRG